MIIVFVVEHPGDFISDRYKAIIPIINSGIYSAKPNNEYNHYQCRRHDRFCDIGIYSLAQQGYKKFIKEI